MELIISKREKRCALKILVRNPLGMRQFGRLEGKGG
jgi:hypothetical protein